MHHQPVLPDLLESIHKSDHFPSQRHRWNTNEEIAALLISFDRHEDWLSKEVRIRPKSGSMMLYSRKKVRYRRDGYCWKKRKDGKTTREDHMKLKVQGHECIYGCYVHSAILPTFHRRCYWLLQNPDIVLVHYLNVPYSSDDNKMITPTLNYFADNKKEWTKEELISELKPMFFSENEPDINNELEISTVETIEAIVQQLMVKQRAKVKALEDATDGGQALTVVTAINNSSREAAKQNQVNQQKDKKKTLPSSSSSSTSSSPSSTSSASKRDVATCIITTAPGQIKSSDPKTSKTTTVQLVQLATPKNGQTPSESPSTPSPTGSSSSLIFNLSQFQSGSGLLILNTPTQSVPANSGQSSMTGPVLLYGHRNTGQNRSSENSQANQSAIPAVVCTNSPQLRTLLKNINQKSSNGLITNGQSISLPMTVSKSLPIVNTASSQNDLTNGNAKSTSDKEKDNKEVTIKMETTEKAIDDPDQDKEEEAMIISHSPVASPQRRRQDHVISNQNEETKDLKTFEDKTFLSQKQQQQQHQIQQIKQESATDKWIGASVDHVMTQPITTHLYENYNMNHQNYINQIGHDLVDPIDLNPMDFIDNDIPTPDDTLLNLDAFDMLGDIGNLDDLTASTMTTSITNNNNFNSNLNQQNNNAMIKNESVVGIDYYRESTIRDSVVRTSITDYCPEWCYSEGGVKVLVAGPWHSSVASYCVAFDGISVTAQLVQAGVLRCYCPPHEPGFVSMVVFSDGMAISGSAIFEYRDHSSTSQTAEDHFSVDDNIFKFAILERFGMIESRLAKTLNRITITGFDCFMDHNNNNNINSSEDRNNFENFLVIMCSQLMQLQWSSSNSSPSSLSEDPLTVVQRIQSPGRNKLSCPDMTLLHLAAALNYSKLIKVLIKWRQENPSLLLNSEIDPFAVDKNGFTSLMWSAARGHSASSICICQWNQAAVNILDSFGRSPAQIARQYGHELVAEEIEMREKNNSQSVFSNRTPKLDTDYRKTSSSGKRNSACLNQSVIESSNLVKCFSTDSPGSTANLFGGRTIGAFGSFNTSTDSSLMDSNIFSSCVSYESEDDREMVASHRGSLASDLPEASLNDSNRVLTLAEQIIAAIPERIKSSVNSDEDDQVIDDSDEESDASECCDDASDVIIAASSNDNQLTIGSDNQHFDDVFNLPFELTGDNHHYRDATATPTTSSPASSSCLYSPGSFHLESPSPPPTTADFCEFFQASGKITKEFGDLTLTDKEQRELYEASRVIQKAYRSYKGRKRIEEQEQDKEKEKAAAILIQSYYRRYKQYIYYRQLNRAAMVIQSQYRSYCEHKRFKKAKEGEESGSNTDSYTIVDSGGVNLVNYHRNSFGSTAPASTIGLKRTYSQRRQHQAARKIQQFMRQSKNKLQKERAQAAAENAMSMDLDLTDCHRTSAVLQSDTRQLQPSSVSDAVSNQPSRRQSPSGNQPLATTIISTTISTATATTSYFDGDT